MKYIAVMLLLLAGCTSGMVLTNGTSWQIERTSFMQKTSVPHLIIKDGVVELVGYTQDVDEEAVQKIVDAIIKSMISGGVLK